MAAGGARVEGEDEVALLRLENGARLGRGPVEQVAGAPGALGQEALEEVLEVAALGGALGALRARAVEAASSAAMRSLSFEKPSVISARNWWSGEPMRVGSRRVASLRPSPSKYVPSSS